MLAWWVSFFGVHLFCYTGKMTTALDQHITLIPEILGGKPCIAGTRVSVTHVVIWHLHDRRSVADICDSFTLAPAQVHAAMTYYYDHQSEVDHQIATDAQLVDQLRQMIPSKVRIRGGA